MSDNTETAILAGGCFWGVQELLRHRDGVISTRVGYTGGENENPTYRNHPGHAEAVEIVFDPERISYRDILELFFQIHDPTTKDRQGNDIGSDYRSEIFYTSDEQRRVAEDTIADVDASGLWPGKVVTEVSEAVPFWVAEAEHQDYLQRYPSRLQLPLPAAGLEAATPRSRRLTKAPPVAPASTGATSRRTAQARPISTPTVPHEEDPMAVMTESQRTTPRSARSRSTSPRRSSRTCGRASPARASRTRRPSRTTRRACPSSRHAGPRSLLGDRLRLAQVRGAAERRPELHHRDRRTGHPLHPRPLEARGRAADRRLPRLAGIDPRAAEAHRPAHRSHRARRERVGRLPRRDPLDAGLRVLRQADHDRLGSRADRQGLRRAHEAPGLRAVRGAGRRLGRDRRRRDGRRSRRPGGS